MADNDDKQAEQPIIIVKRNRGHHDEHHGGVWKIAFADFMTAMMAFFLVMWLINASNEETRAQVASYFNPVKLTDAVAGPKGVRSSDPFTETEEHDDTNGVGGGAPSKKGGGGSEDIESEAKAKEKEKEKEKAKEQETERTLFQDPYAVLVEIAGERSPSAAATAETGTSGKRSGLAGGEAFRDPFDPAFWLRPDDRSEGAREAVQSQTGQTGQTGENPTMKGLVEKLSADGDAPKTEKAEQTPRPEKPGMAKPVKMTAVEMKVMDPNKAGDKAREKSTEKMEAMAADKTGQKAVGEKAAGEVEPKTAEKAMTAENPEAMAQKDAVKKMPGEPDTMVAREKAPEAKQDQSVKTMPGTASKAELAAAELKAEIMAATETTELDRKPVLSVDNTDEGLVVSLTDNLDFGMFASASARPNAEMVQFMDRIAGVLAKRGGRLIVRGHTDSRPFRSDAYDNWRLSTARAHMAYHMLVRGGVDTDRFARIEGYADRDPRNKSDTEAAENRRIEILLVETDS